MTRMKLPGTLVTQITLLLAALTLASPLLHAQTDSLRESSATAAAQVPQAYDVVSIKPNKDSNQGTDITTNDNLFTANHVNLKNLVAQAYTINPDLIYDLPKWASSEDFSIHAKMLDPDRAALHNMTREQWGALLQPMLADRFQLKAHTETRTLPIYELVVAKDGPKFKAAVHHEGETGIWTHNAKLTALDIPMGAFATELARALHRTVIDQTGLGGKYDFTCVWQSPYAPHSSEEDSEASIFTAVQEQLGLKLRPAKGPVTVLVIDHVEPPSPD